MWPCTKRTLTVVLSFWSATAQPALQQHINYTVLAEYHIIIRKREKNNFCSMSLHVWSPQVCQASDHKPIFPNVQRVSPPQELFLASVMKVEADAPIAMVFNPKHTHAHSHHQSICPASCSATMCFQWAAGGRVTLQLPLLTANRYQLWRTLKEQNRTGL